MQYAALDLASTFPQSGSTSSRAYRYSLSAHLTAAGREVLPRSGTTTAPAEDSGRDYLLGFAVRAELRRLGLLPCAGHRRARREVALAA